VTAPRRIVCVGGWGSANDAWTDLARELSGFALDPLPWWRCLDADGGALRDAVSGTPPALLVGWSLGGTVVLRALLDGLAPGVPACLLAATARLVADADYPGADPRMLRAMRMRLSRDPAGVMADFAALCEAPGPANGFAARLAARSRAVPAAALSAGLAFLAEIDLRDRLPALSRSVTWLHGDADAVIPAASARHAAERSPAIRLERLPGAGHALPVSSAKAVAARIREMLP
jgi:pimeloyl-[acyl-carrier protein] methyl ester esterase